MREVNINGFKEWKYYFFNMTIHNKMKAVIMNVLLPWVSKIHLSYYSIYSGNWWWFQDILFDSKCAPVNFNNSRNMCNCQHGLGAICLPIIYESKLLLNPSQLSENIYISLVKLFYISISNYPWLSLPIYSSANTQTNHLKQSMCVLLVDKNAAILNRIRTKRLAGIFLLIFIKTNGTWPGYGQNWRD